MNDSDTSKILTDEEVVDKVLELGLAKKEFEDQKQRITHLETELFGDIVSRIHNDVPVLRP